MEIGKSYYIIAHAYWHFVGTVVDMTAKTVTLDPVVQVHSCGRGWTEFFKDGPKSDTRFDSWPGRTVVALGLPYAPWKHEIPKKENKK